MATRRREAQDILKFFGVPWTDKYGLAHPCPAGCCGQPEDGPCANRDQSVKRAQELARIIFVPPISEPAANKYTKVDPCLKTVAFITWTFGLLRKVIVTKRGKKDTGPAATEKYPSRLMLIQQSGSRVMKSNTRECRATSKQIGPTLSYPTGIPKIRPSCGSLRRSRS